MNIFGFCGNPTLARHWQTSVPDLPINPLSEIMDSPAPHAFRQFC